MAIKWGERKLNEWLNGLLGTGGVDYVIAIDTDSLLVDFTRLMEAKGRINLDVQENVDWLDALAEKVIAPKCTEWFEELREYMNSSEQLMFFDRENIGRGFFVQKKRYAIAVYDSEGYRYPVGDPFIKHMGLETKRSSTPSHNREGLLTAIKKILLEGEAELMQFVKEYEVDYFKAPISEICQVSTANNLYDHADSNIRPKKGCPGHLKGAMLYNRLAAKHNFDPIISGDKIAFVALQTPNSFDKRDADAIAWSSGSLIPQEIRSDVDKYADRQVMYEKHFTSTLRTWCEIVNMKFEDTTTVDDFF